MDEVLFTEEQLHTLSREQLLELLVFHKKHEVQLENKLKLTEERLHEKEFLCTLLMEKLTLEQRKRFGPSSEKNTDGYEQLNLFNEAEAKAEPEYEQIHPSSYKRKKAAFVASLVAEHVEGLVEWVHSKPQLHQCCQ